MSLPSDFLLRTILLLINVYGTCKSSRIRYKQGTKISVTNVAYRTAKPNAAAIGTTNAACKLVSNMIGNTPTNVVIEVSVIALKRAVPASVTASLTL